MFGIQLTIISLMVGFLLGRAFPKKNNLSADEIRKIFQSELKLLETKRPLNIYGDLE